MEAFWQYRVQKVEKKAKKAKTEAEKYVRQMTPEGLSKLNARELNKLKVEYSRLVEP